MTNWRKDSGIGARPYWRAETIAAVGRLGSVCAGLQNGLSEGTAQELARAVYGGLSVAAVGVSNWQTTLGWAGPDEESPHNDRFCPAVRTALESGQPQTCRREPDEISLSQCWQALQDDDELAPGWLLAEPLADSQEVVGVLTVYGSAAQPLQTVELELLQWVVSQANTALELGRLKGSAGQLAEAELKALRAQISPHFLFNTLNTIAALIRVDAEQARELIVDFASFFRRTLKQHGEFVTIAQELEYVAHYVRLESVRFGPNLAVSYEIAPGTEGVLLPTLTIQPLVENAINHGLKAKSGGGQVTVRTRTVDYGDVLIEVQDDGLGISSDRLSHILEASASSGLGVALSNINQRLQKLYGPAYSLHVASQPGQGTVVSFQVPRLRA